MAVKEADKNANRRKSRVKTRMENSVHIDNGLTNKLGDSFQEDVDHTYTIYQPIFTREINKLLAQYRSQPHDQLSGDTKSENYHSGAMTNKLPSVLIEENKMHFYKWIFSCLVDDIARHVHVVAREDYVFKGKRMTHANRNIHEHSYLQTHPDSCRSKRRSNMSCSCRSTL